MEQVFEFLPGIATAYAAFMLGMFSPGPNILSVIGTAMGSGRASGKALALGVGTGSFLWGSLTLLGLTTVLSLYADVMFGIKIAGALYLLWLAMKAFRAAASNDVTTIKQIEQKGSFWSFYRRGLLIQMTNPKAVLTWVAIMSLGTGENTPLWVGLSIVAGTTALSVAGHLIYAIAFSTARMTHAYQRARRGIEIALGTFFCFASYKILTTKS